VFRSDFALVLVCLFLVNPLRRGLLACDDIPESNQTQGISVSATRIKVAIMEMVM